MMIINILNKQRSQFFFFEKKVALKTQSCFNIIQRHFHLTRKKDDSTKRIKYLFYTFIFSSAVLYFVTKKISPKTFKHSFKDEKELQMYNLGIRRRNKLITSNKNEFISFFVFPYISNNDQFESFISKLKLDNNSKNFQCIDPNDLILNEKKDSTRKFSTYLNGLEKKKKPIPNGLITTLVKNEIAEILKSQKIPVSTIFLIKNFPQTIDEVINFENDISDIQKCYILDSDYKQNFENEKFRNVKKVSEYLNLFGKTYYINELNYKIKK